MQISCDTCKAGLTATQAILLAEEALRAGRVQAAECYVTVAYAIFDANFARHSAAERNSQRDRA